MPSTPQLPEATAKLVKDRIAIAVPFSFETAGWFHSFAWAKQCAGGWTVAATPYTAVRLRESAVQLDEATALLAQDWYDGTEWDTSELPAIHKHTPWNHQRMAYWYAFGRSSTMLPLKMGGGKSKVACDLMANWGTHRALLLAPTRVLEVWPKELAKHYAGQYRVVIVEGSPDKKLALAQKAYDMAPRGQLTLLVMSYESAWRDPLAKFLLSKFWDLVALDESHKIKDPGGKASAFVARLGLKARRRLALTGTPMPHSPLDLFAQFRFLDPAIYGTSVTAYRQKYARMSEYIPNKVDEWINQEELGRLMSLCAVHIDVELDLPPVQHIDVPVTLSAKARSHYKKLEVDLVEEITDSEEKLGLVKIDNPLTKVLRLQQVACGFVGAEDQESGERMLLELGTAKTDTLEELLDDLGLDEPVVVFCRFKHDLDQVERLAKKMRRRYGELSGRRNDLTKQATMPADVEVFGVQVRSGGVGIDLTRAAVAVFFSIGCISVGDFDQVCARLARPGQTRPVKFFHLVATKTVDHRAYEAITSGREIIEFVLSALKADRLGAVA